MSLKFSAAVIKDDGHEFAVVLVKIGIVRNLAQARLVSAGCSTVLIGMPIVLAAQDAFGTFSFHGRKELIDVLRKYEPEHLPWKRYSMTDWDVLEHAAH